MILFAGGPPPDRPDRPVLLHMHLVRQACARDVLDRTIESAAFNPIIVATGDTVFANSIGQLPITVDFDRPGGSFHFGRRLWELIERYQLDRVLYTGGAAAPLLRVDDWQAIATAGWQHTDAVVANNINSTDWAVITPAAAIAHWVDRLPTDNALGWVLAYESGLKPIGWAASPATRLDIDVPVDAQIAVQHPACGPRLKELVAQLPWQDDRLRAVRQLLRTPASRLILAGRVPSWAWAQVEKHVQCWTRVYSEERGMRAAGRLSAGQVRSLLNDYMQVMGLPRFVEELSSLADAMLWDTRVVWAARGLWPTEADRYAADLSLIDEIADPFLREFAQALATATIPIVTGGHTLVSGGLWALLESL
jgi:hypothetical protein